MWSVMWAPHCCGCSVTGSVDRRLIHGDGRDAAVAVARPWSGVGRSGGGGWLMAAPGSPTSRCWGDQATFVQVGVGADRGPAWADPTVSGRRDRPGGEEHSRHLRVY
jgi:hypothetical protein